MTSIPLRTQLINVALAWQTRYGVAPAITSAISELDAAMLVGMPESDYSRCMQDRTAVSKGYDFEWNKLRYQVKANRPSGKRGSFVTRVPKTNNFDWDQLVWILYTENYTVAEAWSWARDRYKDAFEERARLSPDDYRQGVRLA